jgi:hypothetical protein
MSKSELVTTFENSLPVELRAQMAEQVAADLARLGNTGGKDSIRVLQDKTFQMPDDTIVAGPLEMVIVDFVYRNEYYTEAFNRKDIKAPACFAVNPEQKLLIPTPNSPKMQVPAGESCNKCQWDKFGSSATGDGKACKNTIYMAVLPTDATEDSPLYVIKTSPTAINPFNNHVAKVGRTVSLPLWAVTSKVFFDPGVTYASLRFDIAGPNPIAEMTMRRKDEARHRLLQEPDFSAGEGK